MKKGSLREVMPQTAKLIDEFREVFGRDNIDAVLKRARSGEPVFYAEENGHSFGTPPAPRDRVQWDEKGLPYVIEAGEQEWRWKAPRSIQGNGKG